MERFLLLPDSFKGTMDSRQVCSIMKRAILTHYPEAKVVSIPVADGGEGSVDAFLASQEGRKITTTVKGPFMEDMEASYALLSDGTAILETASCAGLPIAGDRKEPDKTTTYGLGQLMRHAVAQGCRKLVIGLGGSCTNDCGAGAAAGAGVIFKDSDNMPFVPTGGTLSKVVSIDMSGLDPAIKSVPIIAMCDVNNPLYGENGAAYVFSPQKGADPDMVESLDKELKAFAGIIMTELNEDIAHIPGAGAAGGLGAGMLAFFNAKLQRGIDTILDTIGFDTLAEQTDYIFTGEGKLDAQSLSGKVVVGIARRAKKHHVPVVAVVGDIGDGIDDIFNEGVTAIFSINRIAAPYSVLRTRSQSDMMLTMDSIIRLIKSRK
ncbi:glycerate kinase family protein [Parasphaerochaeta coccoides]|uniref:Glycerate kinase n=1 Tax=Parasphaerochaeta coccoides (strain ATCC BAA-1237 / DSM 17374 / SPN1) TaxID=760011 RepID=F4GLE1_PARC1|nr:glycerate kinase [Parasphaerochaeta coccoides]AEC02973.1 glycerate kinase [Parasphaerochaeta coccoides DSM 17374]